MNNLSFDDWSEVLRKYDEACWEAFEKCGYSREWLMGNKNRVSMISTKGEVISKVCLVDLVPIFVAQICSDGSVKVKILKEGKNDLD